MRSKRISRVSRPPPRGRKAFTLIELLVVIAIVALLMAILFPALQGARKRAQAVKCQGILCQWGLYYAMYTAENNYRVPPLSSKLQFLPLALPAALRRTRLPGDSGSGTLEGIHMYDELLLCPRARRRSTEGGFISSGSTQRAWGLERFEMMSSYGQNGWTPSEDPCSPRGSITGTTEYTWLSCLVKGAANVPMYSDCKKPCGYPRTGDAPPEYEECFAGWSWPIDVYAMDRHNGGINSLFMDWSVRKVGLKELWTLKWSPNFDTAGRWTKAGGVQPDQWPKWMQKFKDY